MRNLLEVVAGLIASAAFVGSFYFWIQCIVGAYQSAKLRKPGRSFLTSMGLMYVFLSKDRYTPEAEPARRRCILGCFGFLLCWLATAASGLLLSWFH
jgi:hypothetical protein